MAKRILKKGTTPVGEVLFAHLHKPEEFNGKSTNKYTIMLKLSEKDKKALLKQIDAEWEAYKENPDSEAYGKKCKYDYSNGIKTTKNGEDYFKFKMTHMLEYNGNTIEKHVPIFDASLKEISKTLTDVGNGSKARIAYELSPFYMNDKNYGVSLRLTGVQILDLVEFGSASASALGFGQEEGFSQDEAENSVDTEDVPFYDGDEEEDF